MSAWTFDSPAPADRAARALATTDGARTWSVVTWPRRRFAPRIDPAAAGDPPGEDLWHLLLGLAYQVPLVGPRIGSPVQPAPTWEFVGIPHGFVNTLRDHLVPGASQLVALVETASEAAADTAVDLHRPVHHTRTDLNDGLLGLIDQLYLVDGR